MAVRKPWHFALGLAVLVYPLLARAQERTVIPVVPAANWHLVSTEPMEVSAVSQYGGDPAIEREYGVKTIVLRKYHLGEKRAEVLLEEAADPTAAYGLLTFYRTEALQPAKEMEVTLLGPPGAAMVRSRFFIRAWAEAGSQISENELRALLIFIGGTRPSHEDSARLPTPLPAEGLIAASEKYLLGVEAARHILPNFRTELIGFDQGAEVQVGTYDLRRSRVTLTAINYPTPQIARARFGVMESDLGINQARGRDSIYGRRKGSIVLLVLDAGEASTAQKLMDQFQITSNVSWNEAAPKQTKFIVEVAQLVLANILLSFFIAGFSVGGGVLIYLTRRTANRFFPKWRWADTEGESIIRLNLPLD